MQWVFDKRLTFGRETSHLSLVASGADALTGERTEDLVARAAREVAEAIPGARGATLVRGTVIREKHATFSLAAGQPARPPTRTGRRRPVARRRLDRHRAARNDRERGGERPCGRSGNAEC